MGIVKASPAIGRRAFLTLGVGVGVGVATAAIGVPFIARPPARDPYLLRIATGPVGPSTVFSNELVAAAAGTAVRIRPVHSPGSLQNLHLLTRHDVDAAMVLADAITRYVTNYRAVGRLFEHYVHVVVRPDSPVTHLSQLIGARVAGADGSGAAQTGVRLLQAVGLRPGTDVQVFSLPLRDSVAALHDRTVDAVIWVGGIPTPELEISHTTRLLDLNDVIAPLRAKYRKFYDRVQISREIYQLPAEYHTVGISALMLVDPHLPDFAVADLTDILLRHSHALSGDSAGSQFMDDGSLINTSPVPLHPGAIQAYRRAHR
jgi:TRAP transporter TAXI family solute receptor